MSPSLKSTNLAEREGRVASLVTRCVYEIATGVWAPGDKLPSVRQAEEKWGLDRRMVMKAYRRLEALGLVEAVDRSGYYVARGSELGRVARHRHELEALYARFADAVDAETGLSPLGVFRYFAHLAEQRAARQPTVAFVECTAAQANGHAREVADRLGVPCLALTTGEIAGRRARIPAHVRTLLVTGFHYGELKPLAGDDELDLVNVPIEVAPQLKDKLERARGEIVILEFDETEAAHIQRDLEKIDPDLSADIEVVTDVNSVLSAMLPTSGGSRVLAMLSPRVWGAAASRWRTHDQVGLVQFQVVERAWPSIADAVGLPLGDCSI